MVLMTGKTLKIAYKDVSTSSGVESQQVTAIYRNKGCSEDVAVCSYV